MNQPRSGATIAAAVALLVAASAWTAAAHGSTQRYADPIVLSGAELGDLVGARPAEISTWIWHHGAWSRVLSQIDEKDADGRYAAAEDDRLDDNDEWVVVLGDLGEAAPADAWPEGVDRAHPRVEVVVSDPDDPGFTARFYLFRSATVPQPAPPPVVAWDPATREVRTAEYTIGLADQATDRFIGVKRLSLYDDPADLVDRMKIRGTLSALGFEQPLTEESLIDALALLGQSPSFDPVIYGPLRVVLSADGGFAYANRFALFGGFGALSDLGGGALPVDLKNARLSLDWSPEASGAIYADPNIPAGVPVDGEPDAVPEAPVPAWREVTFTAGRLALLSAAVPAASGARVYYKDDAAIDAADTGDQRSFGDTGVTAPTLRELIETGFPGEAVVLPIGRNVTAAQLVANRRAPLVAEVAGGSTRPTSAATTAAPPTATPTRTPIRVPSATLTPGRPVLWTSFYLPFAGLGWRRP